MAKPLLLNGRPFSIATPPSARRLELASYMEKRQNTIFTREVLESEHGFSRTVTLKFSHDPRFSAYSHRDGGKLYFGCPGAIEECKREIKRQRDAR